MSSMFNPPHPGLTLRDDILPALDLQVREAAKVSMSLAGVKSLELQSA